MANNGAPIMFIDLNKVALLPNFDWMFWTGIACAAYIVWKFSK
ncbi:hypothetical protein VPy01_13 [Vibrio phage VPy01]|uniref:Uncharacterized protein n=2 Tax=Mardecavirus SSP002 TaxID=1921699 RepID=H9EB88_9CAUD|nr:hypothetical protein FDH27_gp088 [Vibrio phage SSP002]AFE86415.1 hypothetical protein SSP002_088 [Vibrio phage SSP002]UTQ72820.1 hypothetical protein [Vibrio phage vB_VpS_CC6]UZM04590.1 hypothetical protein [Vibrio phage 27Ua.3]WJZ44399.1 hypothetical protein VPy01_13 [Vibrio phage VPy01]